jgi:hypothetical protein
MLLKPIWEANMSSTLAVSSPEGTFSGAVSASKARTILYWSTTVFFALPAMVAGSFYVLHEAPFFVVLVRLGYPAHLAGLLGAGRSGQGARRDGLARSEATAP